jgi:hypothetical protein
VRRELDLALNDLAQLRATILRRQNAEAEVRALYREREIQRAKAAERDPNTALN